MIALIAWSIALLCILYLLVIAFLNRDVREQTIATALLLLAVLVSAVL